MKKKVKILITLILGCLLIFDVYFFLVYEKDNCLEKQFVTKQNIVKQFQNIMVTNIYKNELHPIKNSNLFLEKKHVQLNDIVSDSSLLVLRFSIFNCSACFNFALNKIREHFEDFESNNRVILIYDDENMRVHKNMFGKMPYVTTDRNALSIPLEKSNIPFLFILDNEMKAKQIFVPEKGMPDLTDEYLSIIKRRYFQEQPSHPVSADLQSVP